MLKVVPTKIIIVQAKKIIHKYLKIAKIRVLVAAKISLKVTPYTTQYMYKT